jgi:hypothetical protein
MLKRRTSLALLLVLTTLALGASAAFAQDPLDPEEVFPFPNEWQDDPVVIAQGQPITVFWYWAATTRGQIRMYLNHYSVSLALVPAGATIPVWQVLPQEAALHWGPVETTPIPPGEPWDCSKPTGSSVRWAYTISQELEPGAYSLVLTERFNQPVNDGWHTCTWEGLPGAPTPSLYRGSSTYVTAIEIVP